LKHFCIRLDIKKIVDVIEAGNVEREEMNKKLEQVTKACKAQDEKTNVIVLKMLHSLVLKMRGERSSN
jgi:acetylglutamate kinase